MTSEMLNELKDFEIFVERVEKFVNKVKSDPILIGLDPEFKDYDMRSPSSNMTDSQIFPLPTKLQDYFPMWQHICERKEECKNESLDERERRGLDWVFFDLFWNDTKEKSAYYQDECLSLWFTDDGNITYENPNINH